LWHLDDNAGPDQVRACGEAYLVCETAALQPKRFEKPAAWKLHTSAIAWRISSVEATRRYAARKLRCSSTTPQQQQESPTSSGKSLGEIQIAR